MSKNGKKAGSRGGHQRRISVRAARRESPDLRTLGRAIVAIALAQAEADAEAVVPQSPDTPSSRRSGAASGADHV